MILNNLGTLSGPSWGCHNHGRSMRVGLWRPCNQKVSDASSSASPFPSFFRNIRYTNRSLPPRWRKNCALRKIPMPVDCGDHAQSVGCLLNLRGHAQHPLMSMPHRSLPPRWRKNCARDDHGRSWTIHAC